MKFKKNKPPKILYVYSGKVKPDSGGLDLVVLQQIQALVENGFLITFISRGKYESQNVKNITFKVTPANVISFLPARYYYHAQHRFFSFISGIYLIFKRFDLVIGWQLQSNFLFKVAKNKSIRCILNCPVTHFAFENKAFKKHFLWPHINVNSLKNEYQISHRILVASDFAKSTFIRNNFSPQKVISIGRGADIKRFSFSKKKQEIFRVIFFGRASERKGIFQALAAWKAAAIENGEFLIIGAIPKELSREIQLNLPANVKILGHLNQPEKILKKCSIQILPTRMEGLAKSLIEGAACGLITLTTLESGFPVIEGVNGYYIKRENVIHAAKMIRMLYENKPLREIMSLNSAKYVKKELNWNLFRTRFIKSLAH